MDKRNTLRNTFCIFFHSSQLNESPYFIECSFMNAQLDEALTIYRGSIDEAKNRLKDGDQTVGDIHVMMSTIFQGKNEPESAIECLQKARLFFMEINESTSILDNFKKNLGHKLIEVNACLANLYSEIGNIGEASKAHRVSVLLNKPAIFKSLSKSIHHKS